MRNYCVPPRSEIVPPMRKHCARDAHFLCMAYLYAIEKYGVVERLSIPKNIPKIKNS